MRLQSGGGERSNDQDRGAVMVMAVRDSLPCGATNIRMGLTPLAVLCVSSQRERGDSRCWTASVAPLETHT